MVVMLVARVGLEVLVVVVVGVAVVVVVVVLPLVQLFALLWCKM